MCERRREVEISVALAALLHIGALKSPWCVGLVCQLMWCLFNWFVYELVVAADEKLGLLLILAGLHIGNLLETRA